MASDDDAPSLHPARALPVDTVGEPDLELMIQTSFNHMGDSSWIQAAQVLSSASTNRQNDPSILNNLDGPFRLIFLSILTISEKCYDYGDNYCQRLNDGQPEVAIIEGSGIVGEKDG